MLSERTGVGSASEQEILRLWQGLGYYSRARNLHKCAKAVVNDHGEKFPATFNELLTLPGIGDYTAAAIASFSFKQKVAVVDGNVFRVLSRIYGIDDAINSPEGKKKFTAQLANELISAEHPDLHNQAIMEFGALYCTPKNPACSSCVLQKGCFAFARGMQGQLPVKLKAKKSRKRYFYYFVYEKHNTLWMNKREQKDIWLGLFDFHLIEKNKPVKVDKILVEIGIRTALESVKVSKQYKHILSHQTIFSKFIIVKGPKKGMRKNGNQSFFTFSQIAELPKPVLVSRFLNDHYLL
jgi:A/G-specific adenine glycosylase